MLPRLPSGKGFAYLIHGILRSIALNHDFLERLETDVASAHSAMRLGFETQRKDVGILQQVKLQR